MEISSLFQSNGGGEDHSFLCVIISSVHVQAYLLRFRSESGVETLGESQSYTYDNDNNLLIKTDEALQDLGQESEDVSEVLFGVDPSWVDESGLKNDRRNLLHKLADKLSLDAKGYVMSTEALIHHYKKASASAAGLVVLTSSQQIGALVLNDGQLQKHETIGRSADTSADFMELLARVVKWSTTNNQQLPPRLMLASLGESALTLEDHRQYLLGLDWQLFPIFLHVPTIELVPPHTFAQIMIRQAALAAQNSGIIDTTLSNYNPQAFDATSVDNVTPVDPASFANQDDFKVQPKQKMSKLPFAFNRRKSVQEVGDFDDFHPPDSKSKPGFAKLISKFKDRGRSSQKTGPFILLGFLLGLLTVSLLAWYWLATYSKIIVSIERQAKTISSEVTATLGEKTSGDGETYTLAATPLAVEVEETISQQASGVEDVGDPAEGLVTIYNKTEAEKTLPAGTVLTSGKLKFELTEDVVLPAASITSTEGGSGELKEFGQLETKLRAKNIGEEGNISSGSSFQVADFSDDTYSATAKEDFSGGSSKEVRVVAQSDYDQLLSQAKKALLKDAQTEIEAKIEKGEYFTDPVLGKLGKTSYSAKVGDEAETIELVVTAQANTLIYTVDDINQLAAVVLEQKIPDHYELTNKDPEVLSSPINSDKDNTNKNNKASSEGDQQILLKLSSQVLPVIDPSILIDTIIDKSPSDAVKILQGRSDVKEATINFDPKLASWLVKTIPNSSDRIDIKLLDAN